MLSALAQAVGRATLADWLLLAVFALLLLYVVGTWNYDHFARRGIPCVRPVLPFVGNLGPAVLGLRSIPDGVKKIYESSQEPVVGIFALIKPQFMVRDPEVLRRITVKNFDHFMNHPMAFNESIDPYFSRNLISLRDQKWRDMRATLSPAFTTSKLKAMFELIHDCGRQLTQHLHRQYKDERASGALEFDGKNLFTRFTNDVIATTTFGVRCDSLKEPHNHFYRMGRRLAVFRLWLFVLLSFIPTLAKKMGIKFLDAVATSYFDALVHETIRERQKKNIFRPDMLQLLMQARKGELKNEDKDQGEEEEGDGVPKAKGRKMELSDVDVTAQAIIFFFAGFDTVSTALCFAVYALATHPGVQTRLRGEVDHVMQRTGGKLSYEDIAGMKYLDMVLSESLRLYPPASAVDRECMQSCTVQMPGGRSPIHFQAKDQIWVPVHGIHRDAIYWPDPEKYDPERFSDENKHNIKPFTYMPFGLGPRVCIGQRFALLELKVALTHLLSEFELLPSKGTPVPIAYKRSGGLAFDPKGGYTFAFRPRPDLA